MLRSIQLENFKAFGQRAIVPLAPITLIFGQNSSGKSSILQALSLLKQTILTKSSTLMPYSDSGPVDFGSFQDIVFDHDLARILSIGLDADIPKDYISLIPAYLQSVPTLGLEFSFTRTSEESDVVFTSCKLCGCNDHGHIATLFSSPKIANRVSEEHMFREPAESPTVNDRSMYWQLVYDWLIENQNECKADLTRGQELAKSIRRKSHPPSGNRGSRIVPYHLHRPAFKVIDDWLQFLSSDLSFDAFLERVTREQARDILNFEGLLPVSVELRPDLFDERLRKTRLLTDVNNSINQILSYMRWQRLNYRGYSFGEWLPSVGKVSIVAGKIVDLSLRAVVPIGPLRQAPSRWFRFSGSTPSNVGIVGERAPQLIYRRRELQEQTNRWLAVLGTGYEVRVRQLDARSDLFDLRLTDTKRSNQIDLGLPDVGFGISQVLPIIVQSFVDVDQIITIEQPEVHLHPKMQAEIGDLFIEASREPCNNQFIIETHSEHLVLRLQRRIREKRLSPQDVSIVYINRGARGSGVHVIRLDEDGDFIDRVPGGFFPERLKELQ